VTNFLCRIFNGVVCRLSPGGARSSWQSAGRSNERRDRPSPVDHSERRQDYRDTQGRRRRTGNTLRADCTKWNLLQTAPGTGSQEVTRCLP